MEKIKEGYDVINGKLYKKCNEGQIRNPITKRCIKDPKITTNKNDKIQKNIIVKDGYELIDGKLYKKCENGKIRNPITKRCIINKNIIKNDETIIKKVGKTPRKALSVKKQKKNPKDDIKKMSLVNQNISNPNVNDFLHNFNIPLKYKFNEDNIKKFLKACSDETRPIAKKIIDNTRYVSFDEMLNITNNNIRHLHEFVKKKRPFYIYIDEETDEKIYWLYIYIIKYINYSYPERKIIIVTEDNIKSIHFEEKDTIIFIFDCIYNNLYDIQPYIWLLESCELPDKLNIFILTSFISKITEKKIKKIDTSYKIIINKHKEYIPYTNNILSKKEIDIINKYYLDKEQQKYYEIFHDKYLIYFDYKLDNYLVTIPLFYSGIIPNQHNNNILNTTQKDKTKLEIIPLLSECEEERNFNQINPSCPYNNWTYIKNIKQEFKKLIK